MDKTDDVPTTDLPSLLKEAPRQTWPIKKDQAGSPRSFRLILEQEPIHLGVVEFRILLYLAGRPYHAFTRRNIAEAVSSKQDSVTEDTVDRHVASLLNQLGEFHDYVQSVPYIGYRFKA